MRHLKLDQKRVYYLEPKTAKILTIKLSLEHPICHSGGENHKTHLSFSFLIYFPSFFLVKQTESNFVREREREPERAYLEGLDWRREKRVLKECLWRVLAANIGVNQSIYLSHLVLFCLPSFHCFFSTTFKHKEKWQWGFSLFRVLGLDFGAICGFQQYGFLKNLFTNLLLRSKLFARTVLSILLVYLFG